jgi:hypothetical protein
MTTWSAATAAVDQTYEQNPTLQSWTPSTRAWSHTYAAGVLTRRAQPPAVLQDGQVGQAVTLVQCKGHYRQYAKRQCRTLDYLKIVVFLCSLRCSAHLRVAA